MDGNGFAGSHLIELHAAVELCPEQSRMKAIRSRCIGSILACTLKMKPVTLGPSGSTGAGSARLRARARGIGRQRVDQILHPEILERGTEMTGVRSPAR